MVHTTLPICRSVPLAAAQHEVADPGQVMLPASLGPRRNGPGLRLRGVETGCTLPQKCPGWLTN